MLLSLLLAGVIEGVGLTMLLPIIGITVGNPTGTGPDALAKSGAKVSPLEQMVADGFAFLGITPTLGLLLIILIATVALRNGIMLLANRQIGYTVAQVATDLRLELLHSLRVCRWQYFIRQPIGKLANSIMSETTRTSKAYKNGIIMTAEFLHALIFCIMAFLVSWKATLVSLTAGFIILFALKRFLKKSRHAGNRQTSLRKSMFALLTDTLQSIKPLRAMAREEASDHLMKKKTHHLNKALQKEVLNKEFLLAFQHIMVTVFLAGGVYVLLTYWQMSLTSVVMLVFLISRLLKRLNKIQERYQEIMVNEDVVSIGSIKERSKEFLDNNGDRTCDYCLGKGLLDLSENPDKAVISLQTDDEAHYNLFVQVQDELTKAYYELRANYAKQKFGKAPNELTSEEINIVRDAYPFLVSEATSN